MELNQNLKILSDNELLALKKRLEEKHVELNNTQTALKLSANSCYGALASPWFMYFSRDIGEAITITGQYVAMNVPPVVNSNLQKVIPNYEYYVTGDTDSAFFTLAPFVQKYVSDETPEQKEAFVDEICKTKLNPLLVKFFDRLAVETNCPRSRLTMKRENIADKAVISASKNYILNVVNKEGGIHMETPKLKIVGLETVKSSTPKACRRVIPELVKLVFSEDNDAVIDSIIKFRSEFEQSPVSEISKSISVNDIEKYYSSTTRQFGHKAPMQVKAAVTFNHQLEELNLLDRYVPIRNGDKIYILELKTPNPTRQPAIAFKDSLPEEFGLSEYIDYDNQFEKVFMKPIKRILDPIKWKTERVSNLDGLFD